MLLPSAWTHASSIIFATDLHSPPHCTEIQPMIHAIAITWPWTGNSSNKPDYRLATWPMSGLMQCDNCSSLVAHSYAIEQSSNVMLLSIFSWLKV